MLISILFAAAAAHASLSVDDFHHVDQVTSIFENETTDLQYDYIEDLNDGRGYTAGIAGFTTGTGDLIEVVDTYLAMPGADPALTARWLAIHSHLEDVSVGALQALPRLWTESSATPAFRQAQDVVNDRLNRQPALEIYNSLGLSSTLAFSVIYDTIVQHGSGDDPDGARAIANATSHSGDEATRLTMFLEARRNILLHPHSKETEDCWRESVGRVDALEDLISRRAFSLSVGTRVDVFGQTYRLR